MSDSDDDPGADLSKKERLINAWIAVGPEGKTTDVSDLTGSSRGYASDIRRSMAGDDEEEKLPFEEIEDAHDPDLVERYRSDLADDAVDGHWSFTDRLTGDETDDETESPGPVTGEPVSRSRAGPSSPGSAPQPQDAGGSASRQPRQQPPTHSPEQPRQSPQRPPPQSPRESPERPPEQSPQQPPQQSPQPSPQRAPQQPRQQSARQPPQHSPGHGEPEPAPSAGPSGGQGPAQPQSSAGGQPQQAPQSVQSPQAGQQRATPTQPTASPGFRDRLADLDRQLIAQQQQATAELDSLPQGSQAHAIAISKYNLVVDVRQSLRQLANSAPGP